MRQGCSLYLLILPFVLSVSAPPVPPFSPSPPLPCPFSPTRSSPNNPSVPPFLSPSPQFPLAGYPPASRPPLCIGSVRCGVCLLPSSTAYPPCALLSSLPACLPPPSSPPRLPLAFLLSAVSSLLRLLFCRRFVFCSQSVPSLTSYLLPMANASLHSMASNLYSFPLEAHCMVLPSPFASFTYLPLYLLSLSPLFLASMPQNTQKLLSFLPLIPPIPLLPLPPPLPLLLPPPPWDASALVYVHVGTCLCLCLCLCTSVLCLHTQLAKVVGESADEVDWRRSFYLNLICHTEFTLTVAICSRQDLEAHRRSSKAPVHPISKVTKRVFASPSKARIDVDTSKAQETLPSFPEICFAVDDYDNTFEAVVLEDRDHCFCVMLNAHGGAAFPPDDVVEKVNPDGSRRLFRRGTSSEAKALGEATDGQPKITLFSGFVSYPLVRSAFQGGNTGFSMWGQVQLPKPEKLVMRGPGGRGEADVAVSLVLPAPEVHPEETEKKRKPREKKKKDGDSRHRPSLSELQGKLWSVQSELMGLVEAQQQQQEEVEKDKGKGKGKEAAEEAEDRKRKKEENQQRLRELQVELKSVQEQLQKLGGGGENAGSPKHGGKEKDKERDSSGGGSGSGSGGGAGGRISGFFKKVTQTPPKRTMVHDDLEDAGSPGGITAAGGGGAAGAGGGAAGGSALAGTSSGGSSSGGGGAGGSAGASGAGGGSSGDGGGKGKAAAAGPAVQPLRCCLISLTLPWDLLAFDLLFKEMPIKIDIGGRVFPPTRPRPVVST
ncbi:unnamed protein product [Closterium sp. NIES-53]